MENEEEFVASLKALLIRYKLEIVFNNSYCYLKDVEGGIHCIDEFLYEMVDSE